MARRLASSTAIEKTPWFRPVASGASEAVQVLPASAAWKTREAFSVTNHACHVSFVPFLSEYVAMHVPEAGEPSPALAGGIDSGRNGVQCAPPSDVVSSSKLPSTASPTTMPWVAVQKAMQSRNAFGFCSVYCKDQVLPASVVL